ncbi:MAG TPA: HEAT repeat domain-containing protein [Pyrinomonadaceae bacterium]|nr:HEAT repeat domain-containing protein [Pyrinomonadaceae bacterium]
MAKKLIFNSLLTAVIAMLAISAPALGQRRNFQGQSTSNRNAQADAATVFRSARDLITDGEWAKAQDKFREYVSSFPNEKNLDAALYWLAYSQNKLSRFSDSQKTLNQLLQQFPASSWRDDARVLLAQLPGGYPTVYEPVVGLEPAMAAIDSAVISAPLVYAQPPQPLQPGQAPVAYTPLPGQGIGIGVGGGSGTPTAWLIDDFRTSENAADDDPCEFKIVVLQALFQTDVQRGIVAATEWLKPGSTQTVRCKSAALTLLGRHGGKAVTPVILGVARSEPDLKLRARAISTLGASNDDTVIDALRDFALTSPENDIVEASLYALSKHTGERAISVLSDIAISGKTVGQRKLAISSISTRPGEPAVDALFRIYDADQSVEIRRAVISGFANRKSERAGNKLLEIARGSDNIQLRKSAISAIARRGGDKAVEFLLSLYDSEKNEELRDQIVNSVASGSMVVAGGGYTGLIGPPGTWSRLNDQRVVQKLIEIARDPKAPMERRKRAIGWLSRSKDPAVLKFLEELLK